MLSATPTATPRARLAWGALAVGLALLVAWHAARSSYDHDEIQHLHAAWLVSAGLVPFVDFCEQHHPTFWYLLAPLTAAIHSPFPLVLAARLVDEALLLAFAAMFHRLACRLYPGAPAAWPTLLLVGSFMFTRNMIEVRPDPLMTLLLYAGLTAWVEFLSKEGRRHAALAGLWFGLAVAVLQKALVVVGLVVGASLLLAVMHRRRPARSRTLLIGTALLGAGAAPPVIALFGYVAARGYLAEMWFWNYQFNRFFYLQASIAQHFSIFETIAQSFIENVVLWIFGALGVGLCLRRVARGAPLDGAADARLTLAAVMIGYLLVLAQSGFPLQQYFLPLLPLLALFSAEVFSAARGRLLFASRAVTAAMLAVLVPSLCLYSTVDEQRHLQEYVLAHTRSDQSVFIPPAHNPIFRRDASYFWYNGALLGGVYAEYCSHHLCTPDKLAADALLWRTFPPAFVYLDPQYPTYQPYRWSQRSFGFAPSELPHLLMPSPPPSPR